MTKIRFQGAQLNNAIVATCSMGFALLGYDSGVFGGLTTDPRFLAQFGNPKASLLSFIVSIYLLGALAGSLFIAAYGERWGRRETMMVGGVVVIAGAALQATAFALAHMLVGRVVTGVGIGFLTSAMPVWQGECLHASRRGLMQAVNLTVLIGLGINVAYWLDFGMYYIDSSLSWRFPLAFQSLYAVITIAGVAILPESPRWLAAHDRDEEALAVLTALRHHMCPQAEIAAEFADIKTAMRLEAEAGTATWGEIFKNTPGVQAFNRVWIGMAAQAMQQFCGANAIYYAAYIFQNSLQLDRLDSLLVSGGLQIFFFFASFVPWYLIDRSGRRNLFIYSSIGMTVCLIISAGCVAYVGRLSTGVVASIALYFFQAFFTLGFMSNLWLYAPELLPLRHRARGNALAVSSQWLTTFAVVEFTPPAIEGMGFGIYLLFAGCNLVALPIIWWCFPETAGKNLEEIDSYFEEPTLRSAVKESLRRRKTANAHLSGAGMAAPMKDISEEEVKMEEA